MGSAGENLTKKFKCTFCGGKFKDTEERSKHYLQDHLQKKDFSKGDQRTVEGMSQLRSDITMEVLENNNRGQTEMEQQDEYQQEQQRQQQEYDLQQEHYSEEQRRQQQEHDLQQEQYSEEQRRQQQEYNLQQEQYSEEQRRQQQEYDQQQEQYGEEQRRQQQQMYMQQEQNSPSTDDQSPNEIPEKTVSDEREGETMSHRGDCVTAGTILPLEPEIEKQTGSEHQNVSTLSHVEFREPEKLGELDVSVESSPEVSKELSIDPLTGLPQGWHRTKHDRPKGSPYFHLKPVGSKILRSQIEVNSFVQQQGIKIKISLSGPVTRESPKKKINLKKRLPLLPSSSEELDEKGEEAALEDKSEEKVPKSSVERGTDEEEEELRALLEERNNIYRCPTSERTPAQKTRIYTLLKKITKLKKKFPDIEVTKYSPLMKEDEKKEDTKKKKRLLVPAETIEQANNQSKKKEVPSSSLMASRQEQEEEMSKETKKKKKKKKVPITPSEVVEDDEDKINDPV